jgi:hypothetical protein
MNAMKELAIAMIFLPWIVGIAVAIRLGGRDLLSSSRDIRSQADKMPAFGARR